MSTPPTVRTPPMRGSASIHDAPEPEPEPEPEPSIYDAPSADATAATDGEVEVEGADLQLRGAGNERVNGFYGARGESSPRNLAPATPVCTCPHWHRFAAHHRIDALCFAAG
jgi:hypothetical protein